MSDTKQGSNSSKSSPFIEAVDRVADSIISVGNAWGHGAGSVLDLIGDFLSGILFAIGKTLSGIPGVGKVLQGLFRWLGSIISAGFDFANLLIYCGISLLAHAIAGILRLVGGAIGGIVAQDGRLLRKGTLDFLSPIGGSIIALFIKGVAFIQSVIFMQLGERPLNDHEKETIRHVYRNSIAFRNIRVVEGFVGIFNNNDRPFTLGDRIYLKKVDTEKDPALFAHECCHAWQYQRSGARYVVEALWAQFFVPDAYNWEKEIERQKH